jgi:hypothetical protein
LICFRSPTEVNQLSNTSRRCVSVEQSQSVIEYSSRHYDVTKPQQRITDDVTSNEPLERFATPPALDVKFSAVEVTSSGVAPPSDSSTYSNDERRNTDVSVTSDHCRDDNDTIRNDCDRIVCERSERNFPDGFLTPRGDLRHQSSLSNSFRTELDSFSNQTTNMAEKSGTSWSPSSSYSNQKAVHVPSDRNVSTTSYRDDNGDWEVGTPTSSNIIEVFYCKLAPAELSLNGTVLHLSLYENLLKRQTVEIFTQYQRN